MLTTLETIRKMLEAAKQTGLFTEEELKDIRDGNNLYRRALVRDFDKELSEPLH